MTRYAIRVIAALFVFPLFAEGPSPGEQALASKDWSSAEKVFRSALSTDGKNGEAWFGLGEALYGEQRFSDAADAYKHAVETNFQPMRSQYREAKCLSRAEQKDLAFASLEAINRQGFQGVSSLTSESDFESLHTDSRWNAVVEATKWNATPCEHTAENRQFDFWVGEWSVETTTGQQAGTSKVERILNGCALLENWSGLGDGKSLNIYNVNRKQWQQFWVDAGGEVHEYAGGLVNGEMRFEGPAADHAGNRTMRRMTFSRLDGGRVKQKGEVSSDGKNWSLEYELIYVPKRQS